MILKVPNVVLTASWNVEVNLKVTRRIQLTFALVYEIGVVIVVMGVFSIFVWILGRLFVLVEVWIVMRAIDVVLNFCPGDWGAEEISGIDIELRLASGWCKPLWRGDAYFVFGFLTLGNLKRGRRFAFFGCSLDAVNSERRFFRERDFSVECSTLRELELLLKNSRVVWIFDSYTDFVAFNRTILPVFIEAA